MLADRISPIILRVNLQHFENESLWGRLSFATQLNFSRFNIRLEYYIILRVLLFKLYSDQEISRITIKVFLWLSIAFNGIWIEPSMKQSLHCRKCFNIWNVNGNHHSFIFVLVSGHAVMYFVISYAFEPMLRQSCVCAWWWINWFYNYSLSNRFSIMWCEWLG